MSQSISASCRELIPCSMVWSTGTTTSVRMVAKPGPNMIAAAIGHAGHYLGHHKSDKKLFLILTDGEPSDVDAEDVSMLIVDMAMAVKELDQAGVYTYCINLDPNADDYVKDIFGNQYTVIDHVERLPEKLPQLFMALTK